MDILPRSMGSVKHSTHVDVKYIFLYALLFLKTMLFV